MFPKWADRVVPLIAFGLVAGLAYFAVLIGYAISPRTTAVGYQPVQPVEYSHAVHVGQLGIDCRYCHTTVEDAAYAAIPPTQVCMNCHEAILPDSAKILPVKESAATGGPIAWIRVHDPPGYSYFDHSAHVRRGVGCVSCHGRVDKMEVVYQAEPLNMGWCLRCHREPEKFVRPVEVATRMDWVSPEDQEALGRRLVEEYNLNPSTDCSTCHR